MTGRPELEAVAVRACESAGAHAREQFRRGRVAGEYAADDVKADADRVAEERMLSTIRDAFPDHAIRTEESGEHSGSTYEWVLDPLDGTNNFAAGLPVFASAAAVRRLDGAGAGTTELAVVHEPLPGDTYVAARREGATVNGEPVSAGSDLPLAHATVSFVVGLSAVRDPDRAARAASVRAALEAECKRVLGTWAPCVDWGLLARGGIEAVVTLYPDEWEHHAGTLLAREAGAAAREAGVLAVHAADAGTAEALLAAVEDS